MTTLQVLKLDITAFYGTITTIIAIIMFVAWYRREARKAATMQDLKETEERCFKNTGELEKRVKMIETHLTDDVKMLRSDIAEVRKNQNDILNLLVSIKNNHA